MHASSGMLFNHESPRRGLEFVTKKIAVGVAKIKANLDDKIVLGNLDAKRDWGYAPDYIEAVWLMLQQAKPDDYVVATGEAHSVRDFVIEAFDVAGITNWEKYIKTDKAYQRPADVPELFGDASKIKRVLGWKPKVKFKELVRIMVEHELKKLGKL
jgi:GDPmannose 4,6-dehydratase